MRSRGHPTEQESKKSGRMTGTQRRTQKPAEVVLTVQIWDHESMGGGGNSDSHGL